jgi:hypothetical protein
VRLALSIRTLVAVLKCKSIGEYGAHANSIGCLSESAHYFCEHGNGRPMHCFTQTQSRDNFTPQHARLGTVGQSVFR